MGPLRDYQDWHRAYDDPDSDLSWRLARVRAHLSAALDASHGAVRALSLCSGDGRDLIGVLADRSDADRVGATLVELHPAIAQAARDAAAAAELRGVEVRTADAGLADTFADAVPADLVLLVGIFGNITEADILGTLGAAPALCRPGATLLWSRGTLGDGLNDRIRARFGELGFVELDYATYGPEGPALGAVRFVSQTGALDPGQRLFTFIR